ncbi:hypothetical protein ABI055_14720, partial [Enterococcus faecium]|uniref:WD40 repeat domain-containing protein n=1 Tax=Enterococcus faecium TaxID=1352 RepID=UPI003F429F73
SGTRIVTASEDKTARVWDAKLGSQIAMLKGHQDAVLRATFSPDGKYVATASQDNTARIWDADGSRLIVVLAGHKERVLDISYSP